VGRALKRQRFTVFTDHFVTTDEEKVFGTLDF
jgi:hypothetical protein